MKNEVQKEAKGTELEVCQDIAKRQAVGVAKYGKTVKNNPLTLPQWLTHAYEESLDLPIYLKRSIAEAEEMMERIRVLEDILGSCLSVAMRKGEATAWESLQKKIEGVLRKTRGTIKIIDRHPDSWYPLGAVFKVLDKNVAPGYLEVVNPDDTRGGIYMVKEGNAEYIREQSCPCKECGVVSNASLKNHCVHNGKCVILP